MSDFKHRDPIIKEARDEFYRHQNPIHVNTGLGEMKITKTTFDLLKTSEQGERMLPPDCPIDDEGDISVDALYDLDTGKLLTHLFHTINTYKVGEKTYHHVDVPSAGKAFVIDLDNRRSFPYLRKGISSYSRIKNIYQFGDKEIIIFSQGLDDSYCIDSSGKKIVENAVDIAKVESGGINVDILEIKRRRTEDYSINDFKTISTYLGSDGHEYKKIKTNEGEKFKKI